jgi:crotonobetainyl-CoA:carnitine CoA-transferase CaiB-like acyl-CoA transferase
VIDALRPLAGIRVLDLGTRIAAPFCAGLLGEMGAEVIKVEQPGSGDFMRDLGPWGTTDEGERQSLYWAVEGRGRKSVTIDLRTREGADLFRRLAATADVVCENFRTGTLEKWGCGPAECDPRLVWVRITTYGQDGPNAMRPGLDRVGIAFGGLMHLNGDPDRPPVRVGVTISDYLTGTFAAEAAAAALYGRDGPDGSGRGAVIDAPLYGSVMRIMEWTFAAYDHLGQIRNREGNRVANSAPMDNYPTADGKFVCIVAGSDANFGRLCAAMEQPELATGPFAKLADRVAHNAEINGIVEAWTSTHDAAEVVAACVTHDVPVGTAYTAADVFADPHIAARGDLIAVDDPVLGPLKQQAPFPRFVGSPTVVPSGAPRLGEHTREVLGELPGMDGSDLDRLAADGII